MNGHVSMAPCDRVDWGTPQAPTSATSSAAPDTTAIPAPGHVTHPPTPPARLVTAATAPPAASRLDRALASYLASDDPVPAAAAHEIGDGDFRAIGAEFLRHFVQAGGLSPNDDVLDIGCGFGRMALPLAHWLAPRARYVGFDIVPEPVEWCRAHVAPRREGFAFEHVDFHHPLYNPGGAVPASAGFLGRIPAPLGWRPSFIAAVSVFTHLERAPLVRLLADSHDILRPGGRLFLTAFLTGLSTPPPAEGAVFPVAAWREAAPLCALLGEPFTAAVGVSRIWLDEVLSALGFRLETVVFGHWRRGHDPDAPFQDIVVVTRT